MHIPGYKYSENRTIPQKYINTSLTRNMLT